MPANLIPCTTCGLHLPGSVHTAGDMLYGGSLRLTGGNLAHQLEQFISARPNTSDTYNVSDAIVRWFNGVTHSDVAAAARHWGDLGHQDGSECNRLQFAGATACPREAHDRQLFDRAIGQPPGVTSPPVQEQRTSGPCDGSPTRGERRPRPGQPGRGVRLTS